MPIPASTSWGEEMERGAPATAASSTSATTSAASAATSAAAAAKVGELPPREETQKDGVRRVVEYYRNDDGQVVRRVRVYRKEMRKIASTKAEQERRKWSKFGVAATSSRMEESTTTLGEEVYLRLSSKKEVVAKPADESDALRSKLKGKTVKCRRCNGEHYTHKCPYKDTLPLDGGAAPPADTGEEAAGEGAEDQAEAAAGRGGPGGAGAGGSRYVAPGRRGGGGGGRGGKGGESMFERDDSCTVVITNLAEDTIDDDLKDLCRHFGPTTRIFLAKDRETGYAKGFAFVTFGRREDAANAIEKLERHPFNNVILHADWAQPAQDKK